MSFWTTKAVVTGGAGFIGSHVVEALLERGTQVLVVDNLRTGRQEVLNEIGVSEVELGDIRSAKVQEVIAAFAPDTIFHLAAQINVRASVEDPVFDASENVLATAALLDLCNSAGIKNFVFSSTGGAIYGEQDYFPADEQHPIRPKCPYGVSKRAAEQYLEYYGRTSAVQTTSMRFANVYGPRQNPKGEAGVVAIFTDRLLRGEPLRVNGDGEQTRDFVYVKDVVEAMLHAGSLKHEDGFDVFNVGRGEEITVNRIVDALKTIWLELEQDQSRLRVENGPAMPGEQLRSVISSQKLQNRVAWKPTVTLEMGLRETVRSFLAS